MSSKPFQIPSRRLFLTGTAALLSTPTLAQVTADPDAEPIIDPLRPAAASEAPVRRNMSAFRAKNWQPYFDNLKGGAILVDIDSRALHYWSADGATYKLFPSSVPVSEDLTRRGRTKIVRKVEGPSWSPTPNMRKRNPEWPTYVPPGPDNPLGTHALYLSWKYYRIHGTHDTRKIGRKSSNGCIGLYNEHIAQLFEMSKIGTQVLLI